MDDPSDPETTGARHPASDDVSYDLEEALSAVVTLHARIPPDALTAGVLGTERAGNGVLVREDGLIVTIGYLVAEAREVWISYGEDRALPGYVAGYDHDTGFGLVRSVGHLPLRPMHPGSCNDLQVSDSVIAAAAGGAEHAVLAKVISRSEFAGYWEYLIDDAVFTEPPLADWGGAALIGVDGRLLGIGSLLVQQRSAGHEPVSSNMFVPIDLLLPDLDDIVLHGRPGRPPRPWLGVFVHEEDDTLVVAGIYPGCPADRAGVRPGDVVTEVGGEPVASLAQMFRRVWALGPAGVEVPLTVARDGREHVLAVKSVDRVAQMTSGPLH